MAKRSSQAKCQPIDIIDEIDRSGVGGGRKETAGPDPSYPLHFAGLSRKHCVFRATVCRVRCRGLTIIVIVVGMDLKTIELGAKMQACTEQERLFVWFYVTGDENATAAARKAGYVDNDNGAIRVRAHTLMHRERVLEAIEEVGRKAFRSLLAPAVRAQAALIANDKHPDHARTVQSTLSRLGLGERSGLDVNLSGEVTVNHTDAAVNDLRTLIGLGVAREKLVELFGFSGLERYEKMLAEQERRAPKVIEHQERENGNAG